MFKYDKYNKFVGKTISELKEILYDKDSFVPVQKDDGNYKIRMSNVLNTLVSGENIKTINGNSILGSGNIKIEDLTYGIEDAPKNGNKYVRQDGEWVDESDYDDTELRNSIKNLEQETNLSIEQINNRIETGLVFADEEDIHKNDEDKLSFADRTYNAEQFSGKGYKILRRNIQNGKNILTLDMINEANTVYEIRYDFDLNGAEINIPEGCILKFNGGGICNGYINLNKTLIDDYNNTNGHNLIIKGTISNKTIYFSWFAPYKDGITDDSILLQNAVYLTSINKAKLFVEKGVYFMQNTVIIGDEDHRNSIILEGSGYTTLDDTSTVFLQDKNNNSPIFHLLNNSELGNFSANSGYPRPTYNSIEVSTLEQTKKVIILVGNIEYWNVSVNLHDIYGSGFYANVHVQTEADFSIFKNINCPYGTICTFAGILIKRGDDINNTNIPALAKSSSITIDKCSSGQLWGGIFTEGYKALINSYYKLKAYYHCLYISDIEQSIIKNCFFNSCYQPLYIGSSQVLIENCLMEPIDHFTEYTNNLSVKVGDIICYNSEKTDRYSDLIFVSKSSGILNTQDGWGNEIGKDFNINGVTLCPLIKCTSINNLGTSKLDGVTVINTKLQRRSIANIETFNRMVFIGSKCFDATYKTRSNTGFILGDQCFLDLINCNFKDFKIINTTGNYYVNVINTIIDGLTRNNYSSTEHMFYTISNDIELTNILPCNYIYDITNNCNITLNLNSFINTIDKKYYYGKEFKFICKNNNTTININNTIYSLSNNESLYVYYTTKGFIVSKIINYTEKSYTITNHNKLYKLGNFKKQTNQYFKGAIKLDVLFTIGNALNSSNFQILIFPKEKTIKLYNYIIDKYTGFYFKVGLYDKGDSYDVYISSATNQPNIYCSVIFGNNLFTLDFNTDTSLTIDNLENVVDYYEQNITSISSYAQIGDNYFDTELFIPVWKGRDNNLVNALGNNITWKTEGTFDQRPYNSTIGYIYYCTDITTADGNTGLMIYHKGNNVWMDGDGNIITDNSQQTNWQTIE